MSVAARSKSPNSPVDIDTGKNGPRGTPRGGGPLGGAPRGAPGGGPAWERQRHETFIFYVRLARWVSTARRRSSRRRAAALATWTSGRRSSPVWKSISVTKSGRRDDSARRYRDFFFLHRSLRWRASRRRSARRRTPRRGPTGRRTARRSAHCVLRRLQPPSTSRAAPGGCPLRCSGWARAAVH